MRRRQAGDCHAALELRKVGCSKDRDGERVGVGGGRGGRQRRQDCKCKEGARGRYRAGEGRGEGCSYTSNIMFPACYGVHGIIAFLFVCIC